MCSCWRRRSTWSSWRTRWSLGKRVGRELWPHLAAVVASASFFYVARLSIMAAGYEDFIGALPVLQAALLGVMLAGLLRIEPPDGRTLGRLALVAGAVLAFGTVAIPLQLDKQWITIGWALEGAALAWLYRRIPHRGLFWWAIGLLAAVFARLALNPEVFLYHARSEVPILNWYLYTYLTCAAAMLAAGWLLSTTRRHGVGVVAGVAAGTRSRYDPAVSADEHRNRRLLRHRRNDPLQPLGGPRPEPDLHARVGGLRRRHS